MLQSCKMHFVGSVHWNFTQYLKYIIAIAHIHEAKDTNMSSISASLHIILRVSDLFGSFGINDVTVGLVLLFTNIVVWKFGTIKWFICKLLLITESSWSLKYIYIPVLSWILILIHHFPLIDAFRSKSTVLM